MSIHNVVHGDHVVVLRHGTTPDASQLLHVSPDTEYEAQVNAKRPNICAGLARYPEDCEIAFFVKLK